MSPVVRLHGRQSCTVVFTMFFVISTWLLVLQAFAATTATGGEQGNFAVQSKTTLRDSAQPGNTSEDLDADAVSQTDSTGTGHAVVVLYSGDTQSQESPDDTVEFGNDPDVLNGIIQSEGAQWTAQSNPISILSVREARQRLGALFNSASTPSASQSVNAIVAKAATDPLPARFDWRSNSGRNFVTPIKDQGSCGACWAFASAAAIESKLLINFNMPDINKDLAEQLLVSFANPKYDNCSGGYIEDAAAFLKKTGVSLESCDPYTATNGSQSAACADWQKNTYRLTGWQKVLWAKEGAPDQLKAAIYSYGPVVAGMWAYSDFYSYHSGVYKKIAGKNQGGHAVSVIGWDDADQCFIAKNSWGTQWGEAGFVRIAYSEMSGDVQFGKYTIAYAGSTMTNASKPIADFYISVSSSGKSTMSGSAPLTVTFEDASTSLATLLAWSWDFGDGTVSAERNPVHTYTAPGAYTVSLDVTSQGGTDTKTSANAVTVLGP